MKKIKWENVFELITIILSTIGIIGFTTELATTTMPLNILVCLASCIFITLIVGYDIIQKLRG